MIQLVAGENNKVVLDTAGNSWFTGGNVGIGTDDPQAKLDVQGSINVKTRTYKWKLCYIK